jgi:hypothetical protein
MKLFKRKQKDPFVGMTPEQIIAEGLKRGGKVVATPEITGERQAFLEERISIDPGRKATLANHLMRDVFNRGWRKMAQEGRFEELAAELNKPFSELMLGQPVNQYDCELAVGTTITVQEKEK